MGGKLLGRRFACVSLLSEPTSKSRMMEMVLSSNPIESLII